MAKKNEIALDNDFKLEYFYRKPKATARGTEVATGLTGLFGWLSATDGGAEIHADLKVALGELADSPGYYRGVLNGDALRTQLLNGSGDLVHATVYEVIGDGVNVLTSYALTVKKARRPD